MKRIAFGLALIMVASPAFAISRYNPLTLTCAEARSAIHNEGAVIFRYPSKRVKGMTLFDRYVRENYFCDGKSYAAWTYIPTRDNPNCPVLNCQSRDNVDDLYIFPRNRL